MRYGYGYRIGKVIGSIVAIFRWGTSTPTKLWGTATDETWG